MRLLCATATALLKTYKTIQNVTQAIEDFHFNIAVAQIRNLFNAVVANKVENDDDVEEMDPLNLDKKT